MSLSYDDILLVLDGDEKALEKLFVTYDNYINTLCYNKTFCKLDYDEKQELLLALLLAVKKFRIN